MPWHMEKREGKFCVIKDSDGSTEKCHPTREQATKHMRALYAAEGRAASPTEILQRASTVTEVDTRQRLIDLLAVPWNEPGQVFWRGDIWTEIFHRGAFDGVEERAGRIRVNREHTKGATVGKIVALDPHNETGLAAQVKIVKGPEGDHILDLAEEDMTSASIGYRANKPSDVRLNKREKVRDVFGAFLDHLSFVEDPTWDSAKVLAVRDGPDGLAIAEGPLPSTPALDALEQSEVLAWARARLSRADTNEGG